jgi:hypothetical protein
MKYLVLLGLLASCGPSKLDSQIKQLDNSTKSLQFSTISLKCLSTLDTNSIKDQMDRLGVARNNIETNEIFVESTLYRCIKEKYDDLD